MTVPFEKILTPGVRAGNAVERVGKMVDAGVSVRAIAAQLTENSPTKQKYSVRDVNTLAIVYQDSRTRVLMTAAQAKALTNDASNAVGEVPEISYTCF